MSKVKIDKVVFSKLLAIRDNSKHSIPNQLKVLFKRLDEIEPITREVIAIKLQRKRLIEIIQN